MALTFMGEKRPAADLDWEWKWQMAMAMPT